MMLKCGQKDNKKYTFGVRKDQMEEVEIKETNDICCSSCSACLTKRSGVCPSCGKEL